jgi:hypothetical protein
MLSLRRAALGKGMVWRGCKMAAREVRHEARQANLRGKLSYRCLEGVAFEPERSRAETREDYGKNNSSVC